MYDYRMQRRLAREQRRAYRRQMRAYGRGYYGGVGGMIWLLALVLFFVTRAWIWFPLMFLIIPLFFFVLRPMLFGSGNMMNQQQSYGQPDYQRQEQPVYQPYQQEQPTYQPYTQGYSPQQPTQPAQSYRENEQQQEQTQPVQQQYEEPLTMYPQE